MLRQKLIFMCAFIEKSERFQINNLTMHLELLEKHEKAKPKKSRQPVLAAHICNSSYSGGRDQKDSSLRSVQANNLQDPISKIPNTKKGWWSGSSGKVPA
jgi:hypothetical protein